MTALRTLALCVACGLLAVSIVLVIAGFPLFEDDPVPVPQSTVLPSVPVFFELPSGDVRLLCDLSVRTVGEGPDEWSGRCGVGE